MVSLAQIQTTLEPKQVPAIQYQCQINLNLYDSPTLSGLATQAAAKRYLRVEALFTESALPESATVLTPKAIKVCLCEDDYPGWLALADLANLEIAAVPYQSKTISVAEVSARIPAAIAFAETAMTRPNEYLWGGTVGPNYDCSGLVQTAFVAAGIWLPRDAYQQEAFVQAISLSELLPGDLLFFGTPAKATHVGIYLGNDRYIHSSGKDQGRNGIGVDYVSGNNDPISQKYHAQLRGAGRVVTAYKPSGKG